MVASKMKKRLIVRITLGFLLLGSWIVNPQIVQAAYYADQPRNMADAPLCLPGQGYRFSGDCLRSGPVEYLDKMAGLGITFPLRQLTVRKADQTLTAVPYYYAQVTSDNAPVYSSLEDAVRGEPVLRRIEPGFDFVTYIDAAEVQGKRYYMIDPGIWMDGKDLSRIGATSSLQGVTFQRTPNVQFGWIRNQAESKRSPGYFPNDYTGQIYYRYDIVQIYDIREINDERWYLIGPDLWIEGRQVSRVIPNTTPPEGVENGRWIEVNLEEQTLAVYDQSRLVFAAIVATGRDWTWTQPGLFQIYTKKETETMQGAFTADRSDYYYLEDVPWTMYFDQARALHGTYWHNSFGYQASRGCVNLSPGDANWLFTWAQEGDWVYVWDPSGRTPTDPNLYGSGGA
jgi:hypothetical protein